MHESLLRFLSLLLTASLLLSFPVSVQAHEPKYEQVFCGEYVSPKEDMNVLTSDMPISEWYADRVDFKNISGERTHTYSVSQDKYGLNKYGNMLSAQLGYTYTLWLAQYAVASVVFTANEAGFYSVYAFGSEKYGHTPDSITVRGYTKSVNEKNDECFVFKFNEYGGYDKNKSCDGCSVIYLEKGETMYIAASAKPDRDYLYNIMIDRYASEECSHNWITETYGERAPETCVRTDTEKCIYCGELRKSEYEEHKFCYFAEGEESPCIYFECSRCVDCGKTEWSAKVAEHLYENFNEATQTPCVYEEGSKCIKCGDVEWSEKYFSHSYEKFDNEATETKCVYRRGTRCEICGDIESFEDYKSHGETEKFEETKKCVYRCGEKCSVCGEIISATETQKHTYDYDVLLSYKTEDCVRHCGYRCVVCDEYCEVSAETEHDMKYFLELSDCTCVYTDGYRCVDCGCIEWSVEHDEHTYDRKYEERKEIVFCSVCGKIFEVYEDDFTLSESCAALNYSLPDTECEKADEPYRCDTCGNTVCSVFSEYPYGDFEFVSVTPQYGNVCGAYNFACPFCGKMKNEKALVSHSAQESRNGCEEKTLCLRCGHEETKYFHSYENTVTVAPTCCAEGFTTYVCKLCGYECKKDIVKKLEHDFTSEWITDIAPTCTTAGSKSHHCAMCGEKSDISIIPTTPHSFEPWKIIKPATCKAAGIKSRKCKNCTYSETESITKLKHDYTTEVKPATKTTNGFVNEKCKSCGYVKSKATVYKAKYIELSKTSYIYNCKAKKPKVTVRDSKGKIISDKNYTIKYQKGRKKIGEYTVKVKFKGKYSGSETLLFSVVPKAPIVNVISETEKTASIKWGRVKGASSYKVYVAKSKNGKCKKLATVKENFLNVDAMPSGKMCYFKVVACKKVDGRVFKSSYSKVKGVKIK